MKFNNIFTILLLISATIQSQEHSDTIKYSLNAIVNAGSGTYAPFLSTANKYGRFSFAPNSLSVWGTIDKQIMQEKTFDYGFGMELDVNTSKTENRFFVDESYIEGKIYFLRFIAGTKQEIFGNQDVELSSGGLMWSKNSRPMPKISVETNDYVHFPFSKGFIEVKGGISHGWFNDNIGITGLLLHYKYGSIRLGGLLPINLNYGFHHVAQWGGVTTQFGAMPATWDNYKRIFLGKSGSSTATQSDQINTLGNHIISQNIGIDLKLKTVQIALYWQNLTEDPPIRFITSTMNVADGLWGASVKIPSFRPLHSFLLEYLNTTDQSGPWHDLDGIIYGGADPYYLNGQVPNGWTYRGMTNGNPFLTSPNYNQNASTTITNNLIRLYYFAGKGVYKSINYNLTLAYSENFGTENPSYDRCKKQISFQFETSTALKILKNTDISCALAVDNGTLYGNNMAFIVGIKYQDVFGY